MAHHSKTFGARAPRLCMIHLGCAGLLALALAGAASAQTATIIHAPEPRGIVSLNTSATVELPRDLMTLVMTVTRDGSDAAAVQAQLKQALDAALNEARKAARPGQVDVQTGNFSLFPRYGQRGTITGWQGNAELVVEGRDMPAISQLAGRINTMTVARVGYGLSREAREKVEAEATAAAVERFRSRAADMARLFGYTNWVVREVNVTSADAAPPQPMFRARAANADMALASEPLPVEAGKGSITIGVSGTVQLTK
jgi:predicted secreted protein